MDARAHVGAARRRRPPDERRLLGDRVTLYGRSTCAVTGVHATSDQEPSLGYQQDKVCRSPSSSIGIMRFIYCTSGGFKNPRSNGFKSAGENYNAYLSC